MIAMPPSIIERAISHLQLPKPPLENMPPRDLTPNLSVRRPLFPHQCREMQYPTSGVVV